MYYLHKIAPFFVLPLGVTLILIIVGLITRRRTLVCAGAVLLWISATPAVSGWVFRAVEGHSERVAAHEAPPADAIVVLSIGRVTAPGRAAVSEWGDPDRFFGGVELFNAGKAPLLVFTGGTSPLAPTGPAEGEVLLQFAVSSGVPTERVVSTGRVMNTADEAAAVARLLSHKGPTRQRILLVTSAFHMDRARHLFERAGFVVYPFPVDFGVSAGEPFNLLRLVPSASALDRTQRAVREVYGRLYYKLLAMLSID